MEASLRRLGYQVTRIDVAEGVIEKLKEEGIALAVLALHGGWGENGTLQAVLDLLGIPYTGSGVLASAICMNKEVTKRLLESYDLPTPRSVVFQSDSLPTGLPEKFNLPVVVKPVSQGSTLGVTIVQGAGVIEAAYQEAFRYDRELIVEEYIPGHEITSSIIEDEILPLIEIVPQEGFYDFKAKYTKGETKYIVPAQLPEGKTGEIQQLALKAHQALGCDCYSRIDFRVTEEGDPYILEVNTLPGMTETSLFPKAAEAAGMDYDALMVRIVRSALNKKEGL